MFPPGGGRQLASQHQSPRTDEGTTPGARFAGNGRYCIRHAKGADITYEVAEITDPREPQLVATRTIAVSPFPEDQGQALYFAGYDCNGVPSHNTAWIYRGELPRATPTKGNSMKLVFAFLLGAFTAHAADNSPLTHLSFQRSLQAGVRDANGKLITGTEIDFLVPHQGRLYASNCLWMETDPAVPKACQILVLDSPKGQWRVEREFTVNSVMMRCSVLKEITFATDGRGQAIAPVALLLAVPDAPRGPLKVFCRDDATGDWSPSVVGTATGVEHSRDGAAPGQGHGD